MLPVCENNHNRPNFVFIGTAAIRWQSPDGIANIYIELDNGSYLNVSGIL
jgi:hypothetical protein